MDSIEKALKKLNANDRQSIKQILERLLAHDMLGLDVKKLKGREDIFRIRKGNFRIIYRLHDKIIFILTIERRSDNTYK